MIPIEILWIALIVIFGVIGLARGLWKELGGTTILLLSLFALNLGQKLVVEKMEQVLPGGLSTNAPAGTVAAIYYSVTIAFVAFIAYQGVTLEFPVRKQKGMGKWIFGSLGGLLNGYLIVGTIWDVFSQASYFGWTIPGTSNPISDSVTELHSKIVTYLPVTLMNSREFVPYIFLALGMILLVAIILK